MMNTLTRVGYSSSTVINQAKSRGPATSLVILGLLYCSVFRVCKLGPAKQAKYLSRITEVLSSSVTSVEVEQLAGNLGYAAWVEPFCRPLLAGVYALINREQPNTPVVLTQYARAAAMVWRKVVQCNRGLPFDYVMNKYPAVKTPIFVDASSSWGIGGVHGYEFFSFPHDDLQPYIRRCPV